MLAKSLPPSAYAPPARHAVACFSTLAVAALLCLLGGCANTASNNGTPSRIATAISPYKPEVVQGNFVSSEQVALLQAGLTRNQVKEVLGTPLLASVFHADRWEYVFTLRRQGVAPQTRKLTVFFKGDVYERFEGDPMPSEAEFVSQIDTKRNLGKAPNLVASEQVLSDFSRKNAVPSAAATASSVTAAPAPPSVYPPLEASAGAAANPNVKTAP